MGGSTARDEFPLVEGMSFTDARTLTTWNNGVGAHAWSFKEERWIRDVDERMRDDPPDHVTYSADTNRFAVLRMHAQPAQRSSRPGRDPSSRLPHPTPQLSYFFLAASGS